MWKSVIFQIGVWNGWIFMSVFILQMVIIGFANKTVWKRSHVPNDARKTLMEKYIGNISNFFWLLALIYSVFLPLRLGTLWFYTGLFIFLSGVLFLLFATSNFMTTPVDRLIEKGVYQFSRHPMYLATFLICLGTGLATMSWIFIVLSVIIVFCLHHEALVEEKYCLDQYADVYKAYMHKVPRWLGIS